MESDISSVISSVLADPQLMNKISGIVKSKENGSIEDALPDVVNLIKDGLGEKGERKDGDIPIEASKKAEGVSISDKFTDSKNRELLRSLKPFMSKSRSDMIDNLLKFEQLAEVIKLTR